MKKSRLWMLAILTVCTIAVGCGGNRQADQQQSAEQRMAEARIEEPKPALEGTYLDENNSPNLLIETGAQFQYIRQKASLSKESIRVPKVNIINDR